MRASLPILAAIAPLALAACATSTDEYASGDPLEGVNRPIHAFNETVTREVVAPAARAVDGAVDSAASEEGKSGGGEVLKRVGNVFANLGEPKNAVNGALQGNLGTTGTAVARFTLNSTVGLLGMYDVAGGIGIDRRSEDFGQTLGSWGAPSGPYLVAPLAGPTTVRDATGAVVDTVLNPASLLPVPNGPAVSVAKAGVSAANTASEAKAEAAAPREPDSYATARERYTERRETAIANAEPQERPAVPIEHRQAQPTSYEVAAAGRQPAPRPADEPAEMEDEYGRSLQPMVIDVYPMQPATAPAGDRAPPRPYGY